MPVIAPLIGLGAAIAGRFGNKKPFALDVYPQEVYDEAGISLIPTSKGQPRFIEQWTEPLAAAQKRLQERRSDEPMKLAMLQDGGGGGGFGWGNVLGEVSKIAQIALTRRPGPVPAAPGQAAQAGPQPHHVWQQPMGIQSLLVREPPTSASSVQTPPFTQGGMLSSAGAIISALCARNPALCAAAGTAAGGAVGAAVGRGVYGLAHMIGGRRKYRRMNALNPQALRRALRRTKRFECFARDVMGTNRSYRSAPKRKCACKGRAR